MTRVLFFALLVAAMTSASNSRADAEVAPPPREIRTDGSRDPVPPPVATKPVNPLETVERIIKNSKAVGDKLAMTDTGTDVRKTQDTILKDIQSLIDQDDPPPPKPDQNPDMNKDKSKDPKPDNKDMKKDDMMPMGGMNDMPPKKDMQPGEMDQPPMGGSEQPKGRKPRQQGGDQPKQEDHKPKEAGMNPNKDPGGSKDPKNGGGMIPDARDGTPPPGKPSIPLEDDVVKDVWGHLPDKLRQQATQYYKQEFMPRYAELLKAYYASLSDKGMKK